MKTDTPLGHDAWIVVVGRANIAKSSRSLELMIKDLRKRGFSVQNLEPRQVQTARLMQGWFVSLFGGRLAMLCNRFGTFGSWVRKAFKALWLACHPSRWDFSRSPKGTDNEQRADDLRLLLRHWKRHHPSRKVHLFAHSAGGIVSSWVEAEPNVTSLVCFGYPFKHPQKPEELFRTVSLKHVTKPFLILQGDRDAYGTSKSAAQYDLSVSIKVVSVASNHNYDHLPPDLYRQCLELVAGRFQGLDQQSLLGLPLSEA